MQDATPVASSALVLIDRAPSQAQDLALQVVVDSSAFTKLRIRVSSSVLVFELSSLPVAIISDIPGLALFTSDVVAAQFLAR